MQILIDISKKLYNRMKTYQGLDDTYIAVKHGTPLPKEHGDLIDVNKKITVSVYDDEYEEWGEETLTVREALNRWSDEGITIKDIVILADKAESEG